MPLELRRATNKNIAGLAKDEILKQLLTDKKVLGISDSSGNNIEEGSYAGGRRHLCFIQMGILTPPE